MEIRGYAGIIMSGNGVSPISVDTDAVIMQWVPTVVKKNRNVPCARLHYITTTIIIIIIVLLLLYYDEHVVRVPRCNIVARYIINVQRAGEVFLERIKM